MVEVKGIATHGSAPRLYDNRGFSPIAAKTRVSGVVDDRRPDRAAVGTLGRIRSPVLAVLDARAGVMRKRSGMFAE